MKNERLARGRGGTYLRTRPACDSFVKPDLLKKGRVLHQAQQCGPRRHQRLARLLLRQPVQAAIEFTSVLVEERLELGTGWLIDDILSERPWKGGHKQSISRAPPTSNYRSSAMSSVSGLGSLGYPALSCWIAVPAQSSRSADREGPLALPSGQQHAQAGDAAFEFLELADVHYDRGEAQVVQELSGTGGGRCDQHLVPAQRDDMASALFGHRADRGEQPGRHQLREQQERAVGQRGHRGLQVQHVPQRDGDYATAQRSQQRAQLADPRAVGPAAAPHVH